MYLIKMIMHSQTLISILVWVAVLCFTSIMSEFKSELAGKLNMLVRHPGWRDDMHDVRILINKRKDISDPMTAILEAISSNRNPIDETNVMKRYKEIWTMLMCKYAEIIYKFKILIQNLIRVCRYKKNSIYSTVHSYYDCFHLLLNKLQSVSPRFKCIQDVLEFLYKLTLQGKPRHSVMIALEKLTKYTFTIGPETSEKLSAHDNNLDVVDHEIKNISEYIVEVYERNVYQYTYKNCIIPKHTEWAALKLNEGIKYKKSKQLILQETAMMEYIVNEFDDYINEIYGKWFHNLGFAYGEEGNVTIRPN